MQETKYGEHLAHERITGVRQVQRTADVKDMPELRAQEQLHLLDRRRGKAAMAHGVRRVEPAAEAPYLEAICAFFHRRRSARLFVEIAEHLFAVALDALLHPPAEQLLVDRQDRLRANAVRVEHVAHLAAD